MKRCSKCNQEFESAKHGVCWPCRKATHYEWVRKNPERWAELRKRQYAKNRRNPEWVTKQRKRATDYWKELRAEVMDAYGGPRCACCGETEEKFLSIDHMFNDGAAHRRSLGYENNGKGAATKTLRWLKEHNYPAGFQVLCMNCNFGKARNGGICPHKASKDNRVESGEAQTG